MSFNSKQYLYGGIKLNKINDLAHTHSKTNAINSLQHAIQSLSHASEMLAHMSIDYPGITNATQERIVSPQPIA